MRGPKSDQAAMFSYISAEDRVPPDHPLRSIRTVVDAVLARMSPQFTRLYAKRGRPSIAPEHLLKALLLQVLYTIRSERQLMEQLDYNILYRWFVGLKLDDPVWVPTVFTKNWERLLRGAGGRCLSFGLTVVFRTTSQRGRSPRESGNHPSIRDSLAHRFVRFTRGA